MNAQAIEMTLDSWRCRMPPVVTKQQPRPSTNGPPAKGVLGRIRPVAEQPLAGITMCVYGRNGTGKTTVACTFPKPLLLVGFEDGTRSVRKVAGVDFVQVESSAEALELFAMLRGGRYKSAVLDNATSLQDLILKELLGLESVPVQLAWGTVSQDQYRKRSEKTKELMRPFLDLGRHGVNVVVLAQEKNHTERDGEGGGEVGAELLTPFVGAGIGKSAAGWLHERVDFICQTFVREGTVTTKTKVGNSEVAMRERTGKVEFCLRTARGHPVYAAKMRADKDAPLPDEIVNPTYDKIEKLLRGA